MNKRSHDASLPGAGEGKRGVEGHLGYLLRQAAHAHRLRLDTALADVDLTQPQFAVLTLLEAYPGRSGADLARLALLTPQTMSLIVANLLKARLIERRPHEVHGRIQNIGLTEAGRARLLAGKQRVYPLEDALMVDLSAEEDVAIRRWLVRMAAPEASEL